MQRVRVAKILAAGLLLVAAGCAKQDKGLMGYPKLRSRTAPGGTSREIPMQPPPRILPETYYAAGRMFEQQGAIDKAVEQYRKAVALNHDYAAAYQRLGLVLSITDRHNEALEALSRAVELKPDSAVLRNNLGFELLYGERWAEAERHLREAVRIDPKLARAHINLGLLLARTERYDEALDSFRRALPDPDAYYNLGLVLRAQKRYAQAADAFHRVLSFNAEFTAAKQQLAQIQRKLETDALQERVETTQTGATQPIPQLVTATSGNEGLQSAEVEPLTREVEWPAMTVERPTPTIAETQEAAPVIEQSTPTVAAREPMAAPPVEQDPATIAEELLTPSITERLETPADELDFSSEIAVSAASTASDDRDAVAAATETATQPTPEPVTKDGWKTTLEDVARALDIVDNDRRCREEAAAQTAAEREAGVRADSAASEMHEAKIASMNIPTGPAAQASDEIVLVLSATETRESTGPPTRPACGTMVSTGGEYEQTWNLIRDLEKSLEVIRNEVDCRKREAGSVDTEAAGQNTIVKPTAIDGRTENIGNGGDPCDEADPAERRPRWNASFGGLERLLAIARNEDSCVAMESAAACGLRVVSAMAASLPFVPASMMRFDVHRIGSGYILQCGPADEAIARTGDGF